MKSKKLKLLIIISLIIIVMAGCEEEEYGLLTITNMPTVPSVDGEQWNLTVCYDFDITGYQQYRYDVGYDANQVAYCVNYSSPFKLRDDISNDGFSRSGTYLVALAPAIIFKRTNTDSYEQYQSYMYVVFKNGNATINYNDMSRVKDISGYY